MQQTLIPDWTPAGVLPPHDPGDPVSRFRSPYPATMLDLVTRFAPSPDRCDILLGLLDFRKELGRCGIDSGFQWLNGSFAENVEETSRRSPRDIDVVTLLHLPEGHTEETLLAAHPEIFNHQEVKDRFKVDHYPLVLDTDNPGNLIQGATYWYSLWSHRRNGEWKGYVQIDLSDAEDETAQKSLENLRKDQGDQS